MSEKKAKSIELRKNGFSIPEIAKILKVSKSSVSVWVRHIPQPEKFTKKFISERKAERLEKIKQKSILLRIEKEKSRKIPKNQAEAPYQDYILYGPMIHKNGRKYAHLYHKTEKKWKITLYSRYLMEVKIGKILEKGLEVDHIDNDKTNDSIENLQILTRNQNRLKQTENFEGRILVKCFTCGTDFSKLKSSIKSENVFCSKKCVSKYLSKGFKAK